MQLRLGGDADLEKTALTQSVGPWQKPQGPWVSQANRHKNAEGMATPPAATYELRPQGEGLFRAGSWEVWCQAEGLP